MAFNKLMLIMMGLKFRRNMLVLWSITVSCTETAVSMNLSSDIPVRERMSRPQSSEHALSLDQCYYKCSGTLWICYNTEDRTAHPRSGRAICPCPQVEPRRFCSPSPTALCLWPDPRSAAAGRLVPPSTHTKTATWSHKTSAFLHLLLLPQQVSAFMGSKE